MAAGVASPKAQGQEITKTHIAKLSAKANGYPAKNQTAAQITAIKITAGTKTALILSASSAISGLEVLASSVSFIIWARVVLLPVLSARYLK